MATCTSLPTGCTAVGITTIAMESTGVYWIPVFEILEARGFEVLLVNARDVKHVPGRKTDVNDAQWLQQLHQYGLLRGSFRPRDSVVQLRAYLRHRERLVEYAAAHIQHMQKALMQMNVQLHHVVTDITGRDRDAHHPSDRRGQARCPPSLAEFIATCGVPRSEETLRAALTGNYRPEHVFALRQALELYDFHQAQDRRVRRRDRSGLAGLNARARRLPKRRFRRVDTPKVATSRPSTLRPALYHASRCRSESDPWTSVPTRSSASWPSAGTT